MDLREESVPFHLVQYIRHFHILHYLQVLKKVFLGLDQGLDQGLGQGPGHNPLGIGVKEVSLEYRSFRSEYF